MDKQYKIASIKKIIDRFGLGFGDLPSSPDYEQEMIVAVAKKELNNADFQALMSAFSGRKILKPRTEGCSMFRELETGFIHSAFTWSKVHSKGFYKAIRLNGKRFTFKGKTYVLEEE